MSSKGRSLLLWVAFVHLVGIYLYSRGFLLTRVSLSDTTTCLDGRCTMPASHKRAIILVVDALRFDFLSPHPPEPSSPHYHHVLVLPQQLTESRPANSLLFEMFSEPPTTTTQRLKAIVTGSLSTFIDVGLDFAGSAITQDSFICQLRLAGKKVGFMGDDTWTTVFPNSFEPNMTYPYDSFNIEDLHTVDEGVIEHLFPILQDKSASWDVLIGHFLGVDHVGHRVGPDHPIMKAKLKQMDEVLRRVVGFLDDDTLLVVMGDHGMDSKGDHGGDSDHETSAALWVYSKTRQLVNPKGSIPEPLLTKRTFPGATVEHRLIQQIDITPTLSLALGLPIPHNNLGTVIPEVFWRDEAGDSYTRALSVNAVQVNRYLNVHRRASTPATEWDGAWDELEHLWAAVDLDANAANCEAQWLAITTYTRSALAACRMLWAQFDILLVGLGLVVLLMSTVSTTFLYFKLRVLQDKWEPWAAQLRPMCITSTFRGGFLGLIVYMAVSRHVKGLSLTDMALFGGALASSLIVMVAACPSLSKLSFASVMSLPFQLFLHAATFSAGSLITWEDRVVTYLLITSLMPAILAGIITPTVLLRYRILGFSALFAVCVQLMAVSTVCREEQQPSCHVTFFASSSLHSPPLPILVLSTPVAFALPWVMRRFLKVSKSDQSAAAVVLPWLLPAVLVLGSGFWIIEHLDSSEQFGPDWRGTMRFAKTTCGRLAMGGALFLGYALWWLMPFYFSVDISTMSTPNTPSSNSNQGIAVVGIANAYGAPYLVFWSLFLGFVYPATQLTGQVTLALATVAVLAHLEVVDSVRTARGLATMSASGQPGSTRGAPLQFSDITPLALLATHAFFATGHQAALSSMQWKTGFVLTPTLTQPFSPLLLALNTLGPHFLVALAVPLLALWNIAPLPHPAANVRARAEAVRAALGVMLYHAVLLLSSATCAALLRRHLIVWKVFAPRFMLAAAELIVVDGAVLFGVGVGVAQVSDRATSLSSAMYDGRISKRSKL